MSEPSKQQIAHGNAIARRRAINGQPNGYKPVTEAELQAMKDQAFKLELEAMEGSETRRKALAEQTSYSPDASGAHNSPLVSNAKAAA